MTAQELPGRGQEPKITEVNNFALTPECGTTRSLDWAISMFHESGKPGDFKFHIMCDHIEAYGRILFHEIKATYAELKEIVKANPQASSYFNTEQKKEIKKLLEEEEAGEGK
jgi:hypothetical protein